VGKADLHAHTCHDSWGDGNQTVENLFRFVEEKTDLDLFAVTDHDSTDAARAAWRLYRRGGYRFGFIPGVEVTNQSGHLLCYFPAGNIVDVPSLRPFWATVRYVHDHGGICVAAHPIFPPWLAPSLVRVLKRGGTLDGIEVVNAGISAGAQERLDGLAEQFAPLAALVGNSDAHDQEAIGSAFTRYPGKGIDDFLQALYAKQTEPVFVKRPRMRPEARAFTTRRSMTRPGWVRNVWREVRGGAAHSHR
jgi:predicted metal-dependent phosphoesterase TrpH